MWIVRINMTDRSYKVEDVPEKYAKLGGRGITSMIVADEVPPLAHPLGPNNKLVIAPGLLSGTAAPTSSRISVGAKSPLTGGIKESNAGAAFAPSMNKLGIKAIVIEGKPEEKGKFWTISIKWGGDKPVVEFHPADEYVGQSLYKVFPKVYEKFGKVNICGIGTAGELGYGNSGVVFDDLKGRPSRYSGRGGTGAVMGSKGVKFIVIDPKGGPGITYADKARFNEGAKKLRAALMEHPVTKPKGGLNTYGTAILVNIINEAGALPTRNFRSGRFEGAAKISGEAIFETNKERTGKEVYNHACSPGCIIQCSNTYYGKDGKEIVSCIEYESDWALGANCGIDDLDAIAEMVRLCNDYGLDTIEMGDAIAVAMDAGYIEFGDAEGAIKLIHEVGKGTPIGRILGSGTETTGRVFANPRIPTVKGQGMPAYEPRAIKGIGVTYATTPMGADHTSGYTIATEILNVGGSSEPLKAIKEKAKLSRDFQATTAFLDMIGHCIFIAFAILDIPSGFEGMVEEVNGLLGTDYTGEDVGRIGMEIVEKELAFNHAAGFTKADDRLPEFMKYEKLPPHNVVNDLPDEIFDAVWNEA